MIIVDRLKTWVHAAAYPGEHSTPVVTGLYMGVPLNLSPQHIADIAAGTTSPEIVEGEVRGADGCITLTWLTPQRGDERDILCAVTMTAEQARRVARALAAAADLGAPQDGES